MSSRLRIASGLALIAAVTLMLELTLIRAFDAMMNAEMSHLIITCAMFAFGLSGLYESFRPSAGQKNPEQRISLLAVGFALFTVCLLPLFNLNPFNYSQLRESPGTQTFYFGLMYITLMIPFFLSGRILTTIFSTYPADVRRLYCFDLCGAAVGSIIFIPFIPLIGPGGLLFPAAALALLAAVLFSGKLGRTEVGVLVAALLIALAPFVRKHGYVDFVDHEDKRDVLWAKEHHLLETTRWDPVAKIEIVQPRLSEKARRRGAEPLYKHVAYDGGEQSSRFYRFDGDLRGLRRALDRNPRLFSQHFWNRSVAAADWFKAGHHPEVLIIGSAGGQETKAALLYRPRRVDTVEMVNAVVDLATHEYSDYIGNIFKNPRVHPHVGEGRTFLRRSNRQFDIIQIFSNHTSSSMAAGGAPGRGVYLQTVEAYREYFSGLKPDGMLQINHHLYPRVIATAAAAWSQLGRSDFRKHVIVFERKGLDMYPLILFKMTPWTEEDVARMSSFMLGGDRHNSFRLVENPLKPERSFLSNDFYSGHLPPELVEKVPYRITPPTDDRPYFNFVRKHLGTTERDSKTFVSASVSGLLNSQLTDKAQAHKLPFDLPLDVAHYLLSSAIAGLFAILFIVVPLLFGAGHRNGGRGALMPLFYFSCLGAGFIIIELTLAPILLKLIGIPLYSYSTVIFTMLAAAGIGSHAASALRVNPQERWWLPYAGTLTCGLLLITTYSPIIEHFVAAPLAARILISGAMVFPISFFMGMCLPLGILAIQHRPPGTIAWAWGMNGLFTTIGGLSAALCSMFWGFRVTLLMALGIYALAGLAFVRMRRTIDNREQQPAALEDEELSTEPTEMTA